MNPKIAITIDAKNKAIATITGMATVGAKVDVEVVGLPSDIPNWEPTDKWTGASVRFRVVDAYGKDLVRFPLIEKTSTTLTGGDKWTVIPAVGTTTPETYKTNSGATPTPEVDFNTDGLRRAMCGVPFNECQEFGIILDSIVDAAQYAVGKIKIRQWAAASTEDPTVLPDWRAVVTTVLDAKDTAVTAASTATTQAGIATTKASEANNSASAASTSATSASTAASNAADSASDAADAADDAEASKDAAVVAKTAAETAATKYPYIDANGHWQVWENGAWVDKGASKGETGTAATIAVGTTTTGAAGTDASVTNSGTTSAAVFNFTIPRGATGEAGTSASASVTKVGRTATITCQTGSLPVTTATVSDGIGVPEGGTTGQVVIKTADATAWKTLTANDVGAAHEITTGSLGADSTVDDIISKINTLIAQLKG